MTGAWRCLDCGNSPIVSGGFLHFAPEVASASEDFDPEVFARLAALEAGSFWFRSRSRLIGQTLQRWFPGMNSFLEVGCGSGFVLRTVSGISNTAARSSPAM